MALSGRVSARRARLRRWGRRALLACLALLLGAIGYAFYGQISQVLSLRAEHAALSARTEDVSEANRALAERLNHRDDPDYMAYLAREQLGLIAPGEVKVILPPSFP